MKTRPKPAQVKKTKMKAPPRGSFGFWVKVAITPFFYGLIVSIIFVSCFQEFGRAFTRTGLAIGWVSLFFYARYYKNKLIGMDDEDYEEAFKKPCCCHNNFTIEEPNLNPMDPKSPSYWIIGPGSES